MLTCAQGIHCLDGHTWLMEFIKFGKVNLNGHAWAAKSGSSDPTVVHDN
jgi:hypothetical protein